MEEDIVKMFKDAENDHAKLKALKTAAIKCQNFVIAANLRDIEKKNFPESKECTEAKTEAQKLNTLFRMVDLNIPNDVAWLINETIRKYRQRRGNFDLKDAALLRATKEKFWPRDGEQ